jgi:hypothetical protein
VWGPRRRRRFARAESFCSGSALTGMSHRDAGRAGPKAGNDLILSGMGVGAIGVAGAVLLGATCPLCVVATPALIGAGLVKKWRVRRLQKDPAQPDEQKRLEAAIVQRHE